MTTMHPSTFPTLLEMMIINTTIFNILINKKIILEDKGSTNPSFL